MNAPKVKITLRKEGTLSRFGYRLVQANAALRREALRQAVAYWGSSYVIKKVTVLATYRKNGKNKIKTQYRRARDDIRYVQRYRDRMSNEERAHDLSITRARLKAKKIPVKNMYQLV